VKASKSDAQISKLQARVAICAGVLIVIMMSGTWFYLARAVAENHLADNVADGRFFGQVFTALALTIVAGLLGITNGIVQLRSGQRNVALTTAMFAAFLAAFGLATATIGQHS
jgi:hypothetical protein